MQYTKKSTLATYAMGILLGGAFLFTTSCSNSGGSLGMNGTNDEMSDISSVDPSMSARSFGSNSSWTTNFSVSSLPSTFWWSIKAVSGFNTKIATSFTKMFFGENEYCPGSEIEMADQSEGPHIPMTEEDIHTRTRLMREKKLRKNSGPVINIVDTDEDCFSGISDTTGEVSTKKGSLIIITE